MLNGLKEILSVGVLIFSIVIVSALIFDEQTSLSQKVHPALAFVVMWGALIWLSMVEGSQASMVGLPPVDRELFKETHPIAYKICARGHKGDNLDRYLLGRQFMVLVLVFVINICGAPAEEDASVLSLPTPLANAFLKSGLAMILFTCMIGQLNTQVNASHCMLDYLNDHFAAFTVWVAMTIEASGILHASYLIQQLVAALAKKKIETDEPPRETFQNILFWAKTLISCLFLAFAMVVTLVALFDGKTTMWEGVPSAVAVVIFFILMAIVGMLEGMQIAFFAVAKITQEERNANVWAKWTCEQLFGNDGRGLPGFMIGRQLAVVACFFVIARVTTVKLDEGDDNVLGMGDAAQTFFETGLLGALITTIVASIAWQLVASAFPLAFLGNPVTYLLLRVCLFLEATGIASGAWVIALVHQRLAGFQKDEEYIGTAEERAAMGHEDHVTHKDEVGHLTGGAYPANHDLPRPSRFRRSDFTEQRSATLAKIQRLRHQAQQAETHQDQRNLDQTVKRELNRLKRINREHDQYMREQFWQRPATEEMAVEKSTSEEAEEATSHDLEEGGEQ